MKSEHRHELKTNELAEWIINFPKWAQENSRTIIYVVIAAVLVICAYFFYLHQKHTHSRKQIEFTELLNKLPASKMQLLQAQAQGKDDSTMLLQFADEFQTAAQNAEKNQQATLALIKRGQLLRTELHYRLHSPSDEEIAAQINLAKVSYNEALSKAGNNSSLAAMATLGLGLCEEELGNFDKAEQIYRDITANTSFDSSTAGALAAKRLDVLDNYKQKVVFKEPPKQAPVDFAQPQIQLDAADFNLPD